MWVFEDIWVICAKPLFLHGLDVQIEMFANTLAVLNQQMHMHCFETLFTESFYISIFVVCAPG